MRYVPWREKILQEACVNEEEERWKENAEKNQ